MKAYGGVDVSIHIILASREHGSAVAQAVNRWLPTAAGRVRVEAACWVCGGQSRGGKPATNRLNYGAALDLT
jgi:hypothetical protein